MPTSTDTVTIQRQHLLQALNQIGGATARRSTSLPVLTGVHLRIGDGQATVTATDLELAVTTRVPAQGELEAVVPHKLLRDLLQQSAGPIGMAVTGDRELEVRWGRTTAQLRTLPLDEWPGQGVVDGPEVKLTAGDVDILRRLANYASKDDARPILTGIRLGATEGAATDSYRLAVATWSTPLTDEDPSKDLLLPARAVRFLPRLLDSEHATLTVDDHHLHLELGEIAIRAARIHGDFPPYKRLIPTITPSKVTFKREELIAAVRAATVLCRDNTPVRILLDPKPGQPARIVAVAQDVGEIDTDVDAVILGNPPPATAAFNPRYLLDLLETCSGPTVTLELVDHLKPAVVREDPYTLLIMPVRIS